MKHTAPVRTFGISACFLLLFAAGAFSASKHQATASQSSCSDNRNIETSVKATLSNPSGNLPAFPGLDVKVNNNAVRVRGTINSSTDVGLVEVIVRQVPCVQARQLRVNTNDLQVDCSNDRILARVKRMLATLPCAVSSGIAEPTINNNRVITLTGSVPSQKDKEAATHAAEAADCVRRVKNDLIVTAPPSVDCSTLSGPPLKAAVEGAIRSKISCGGVASDFQVQVTDRVVTLTGKTINIDLIVRAARSVCPGIEIRNQLQVFDGGPECPPGARSCTTGDGESFCCTGCASCPRTQ